MAKSRRRGVQSGARLAKVNPKSGGRRNRSAPLDAPVVFDTTKFENVHQVGGIRTATLDGPGPGVGGQGSRGALVDTGSGLRFTVALDRGGDIVDASYNQFGLAYRSPVGLVPPNP